jgi:hypothetical protein
MQFHKVTDEEQTPKALVRVAVGYGTLWPLPPYV